MRSRQESKTDHALRCMEIRGGNVAVEQFVTTPGLEIWVASRPHQASADGGDVHYVSLCGGGLVTRLVLADVSGHGASAATFGRVLRDLVRRNINRKSQARMLTELNREFADLAELRHFATAVVATYLANRAELSLSNAGHPRPLWYQANQRGWRVLDTDRETPADVVANLPWGIDESSAYPQLRLRLGVGDLVLTYTDAFVEAASPAGRQLGEAGLRSLVEELDPSRPADLLAAIWQRIEEFRGGAPADDDATLLLIRHQGGGPRRRSLSEVFDIYAKVFRLKSI